MNKRGPPEKPQIDRFRETARELGADDDEAAFRDKLRVIARQKLVSNTELDKPRKSAKDKRKLR